MELFYVVSVLLLQSLAIANLLDERADRVVQYKGAREVLAVDFKERYEVRVPVPAPQCELHD